MNLTRLLALIFALYSAQGHALGFRHMVSFSSQGLGWSGAVEKMDTDDSSPYKSVNYLLSNLALNYAYLFTSRLQVGGFYQTSHQEHRFKKKGGGVAPTEREASNLGLFVLYNFDSEISNAYYVGASVSMYSYEEENSHDLVDSEGKNPFELDDAGETYELLAGRRFSLKKYNIDHLTYAPQIGVFHRTHSKDFDDQDIGTGLGVSFLPIKFDLLF